MKVYLAKSLNNVPFYDDEPDLTMLDGSVVDIYDVSDEELEYIKEWFLFSTNKICDSNLDIGDYQFYDIERCRKLSRWLNENATSCPTELKDFLANMLCFLDRAIESETGIAIEL